MIIELVLQWLLVTVLLVLINGAAQQLPWGIGSAKQYRQSASGAAAASDTPKVVDLSGTPIVTDEFDARMSSHVSTLTTDRSFSWIVSKPLDYYRPSVYLAKEVLTQALVAVAIVNFMTLIIDEPLALAVVALAAVSAAVAIYGQLTNWWGLTLRYAIGVSATLIISWVVAAGLIALIW